MLVKPDPSPSKEPENDPENFDASIAPSTVSEANSGLEPERAIFFQFGIIYSSRLVAFSGPLPPKVSPEANKCLI